MLHPGVLVVRDSGKVPAQLDHSGQLVALEISLADRRGGGFVNCEHHADMGGRVLASKLHRDRIDFLSQETGGHVATQMWQGTTGLIR